MIMHSKLSDHKFKKGEFITPWNNIPNIQCLDDEACWVYGRMPEYLWIGMILDKLGRDNGIKKIMDIFLKLHQIAPSLTTVRISQILSLDKEIQRIFFQYITELGVQEALVPLTILFTYSNYPVFTEFFYNPTHTIDNRLEILLNAMQKIMDHQSNESTDIRYLVLIFYLIVGKLKLLREELDLILMYPSTSHESEIMRKIRPSIRATEMVILYNEKLCSEFLQNFWRNISMMSECDAFPITFPKETRPLLNYMKNLYEIFSYLNNLFISCSPLDEKMNVLLGIATYSYKRLKEIYDHNLFNSISGRGGIRALIENYIMMKYLVKNEADHDNIWQDYQLYGIGCYKLVLSRYREKDFPIASHCNIKYIEALVNEFTNEEYINMDTKYFDKQNIRTKAENVDEKDLYGLYYDYDSSFEHGLWGAIRESSFIKCLNPAHKYHCIPDIEDKIRLKSVLPDCIMVMNKIILFLNELYGIPEQNINEVINFEKEFTDKQYNNYSE